MQFYLRWLFILKSGVMEIFKPEDRANFLIQEFFLNGRNVDINRLIHLKYEMDNSIFSALIATKEALIAINTIHELVKDYNKVEDVVSTIKKINQYYLQVFDILEIESSNEADPQHN